MCDIILLSASLTSDIFPINSDIGSTSQMFNKLTDLWNNSIVGVVFAYQ